MANIFSKFLNKLTSATDELPKLHYHMTEEVISFEANYLCSVIAFDGINFEAISDNHLESDFDALNLAYTELAKDKAGRLQFYTYQLRRKIEVDTQYEFDNQFCQKFSEEYLKRFNDKDYYNNLFYIALVMKYESDLEAGLDDIQNLNYRILSTLSKYQPRILKVYQNKYGILSSEVLEFFYEILNGEKPVGGVVPLTPSPAYEILPSANLHFGHEILQMKGDVKNRFACLQDLKDFPNSTHLGLFDSASLALPFEYNLVQSFVSLAPAKALTRIERQANQMRSADDKAVHQRDELQEAQGQITSGKQILGEYHASLVVFGDTLEQAVNNMNEANASFSNKAGAVFKKASVSAPATFFSQFPTYRYKPRPMLKTSRNLASTFSLHNYSTGKVYGNPLGDGSAVMPLETVAKTLYNFNFHFTNIDENNVGEAVAGHTLILGATGTGKTTLQSAMTVFVQRFNPAMFVLDKDRGMDIFIRALDGDYFAIEENVPTGINPFQFNDGPRLRDFLNTLVIACATDKNNECTSEEQNQIKLAVDTVMSLPFEFRRMSAILQSLPDRGGNSLYARLVKWCTTDEYGQGAYAWVLDNPVNLFNPDDFKIVGFDVGSILKENYQPTEPLLACLLYIKTEVAKRHNLLLTVVEEFWLPLKYKTPREMILDVLKTGRKRLEFMLLVTQSPEEAVQSEIFPAIIQQTPTKILLPNPDAEYQNAQGGGYIRVGLTEKEFAILKSLNPQSRIFLVKQGQQSSFAKLDLYGFSDEISVLSSTKENVELLDDILSRFEERPKSDVWLPIFYQARKDKKQGVLNLDVLVSEAKIAMEQSTLKRVEYA
jgi:type IV secretion system protein VirB4